jgi:hypothetical protein
MAGREEPVPDDVVSLVEDIDSMLAVFRVVKTDNLHSHRWWNNKRIAWREIVCIVQRDRPSLFDALMLDESRRGFQLLPADVVKSDDMNLWTVAVSKLLLDFRRCDFYPFDKFVAVYPTNRPPSYMEAEGPQNNIGLPSGVNPRGVELYRLDKKIESLNKQLALTQVQHAQHLADTEEHLSAKYKTQLDERNRKIVELTAVNEQLRAKIEELERKINRMW